MAEPTDLTEEEVVDLLSDEVIDCLNDDRIHRIAEQTHPVTHKDLDEGNDKAKVYNRAVIMIQVQALIKALDWMQATLEPNDDTTGK